MVKTLNPIAWLNRGESFLRRRRFASRLPSRITALDVDGEVLRLVHTIYRYGRTRVTRFAAERLEFPPGADPTNPQVMGQAIAQAMDRLGWKPTMVVMGVQRGQVVLRSITLPQSQHAGELAAMVHFQVAKDLPYPIEEAVVDFTLQSPLPQSSPPPSFASASAVPGAAPEAPKEVAETQPKIQVLVAAVKQDVLKFYKETAAAAGFNLAALGLRSYANARCVEACQLTAPGETVALISLRPDEAIIDVLEGRFLAFSREAAVSDASLQDVPIPEESDVPAALGLVKPIQDIRFARAVTIEVVRSLHSYQGTSPRTPVSRVVVAGGTGHERDVVQALQNRLSIPVSRLDPASALGLPESIGQHASGALVVFGLAIGANDREGLPFDFLRPKRPAVPQNTNRLKALGAAAALTLLVVLSLGFRHQAINQRKVQQARINEELTRERAQRPLFQKTRLFAQTLVDWESGGRPWLDDLLSLSTNLPPQQELYLSSITMAGRGSVRMAVAAKSGEILGKLEKQLTAAGCTVKPLAITPGPDKYGYSFKSNIEFIPPSQTRDAASVNSSKSKTTNTTARATKPGSKPAPKPTSNPTKTK